MLKFALCYGLQNLVNIVQKLKTGKCDYHFLEIMACPSSTVFSLYLRLQNLVNIVQKLKTGKCDYHFLEIMACPSGTVFSLYLRFYLFVGFCHQYFFMKPIKLVGIELERNVYWFKLLKWGRSN